ncbi:hypothetical protein HID58_013944 [Brassica napus]|uniref:Uncharacterized protein n=1 Tax=Brassica napus TaxID=3708 RepID=A0ABQ8DFV4_BRANA|nr:hypothetical protein HID58_013944 [Brassica napus]
MRSLMSNCGSSKHSESNDLTPAKLSRTRILIWKRLLIRTLLQYLRVKMEKIEKRSLMSNCGSSKHSESNDLTPAKLSRTRILIWKRLLIRTLLQYLRVL